MITKKLLFIPLFYLSIPLHTSVYALRATPDISDFANASVYANATPDKSPDKMENKQEAPICGASKTLKITAAILGVTTTIFGICAYLLYNQASRYKKKYNQLRKVDLKILSPKTNVKLCEDKPINIKIEQFMQLIDVVHDYDSKFITKMLNPFFDIVVKLKNDPNLGNNESLSITPWLFARYNRLMAEIEDAEYKKEQSGKYYDPHKFDKDLRPIIYEIVKILCDNKEILKEWSTYKETSGEGRADTRLNWENIN